MFNDRDEFINVRHRHPHANLRHFFLAQFDKPEIASLTYWNAKYFVHCKMDKVGAPWHACWAVLCLNLAVSHNRTHQ